MKIKILAVILICLFLSNCSPVTIADTTVYITETGSKYHRGNCQYLSKSKIAISLEEACRKGYKSCSVCKPPECK